jgi:hypothetical protein
MSHDVLCPQARPCRCDLIAKPFPPIEKVTVKAIQNPGRIPWHEGGCPMQECAGEEHDFMGGGYDYRCKNCEDGLCECNCDAA